jgi:hypothetical protein
MSTIMSLMLGPTWYDLYRDPDDLAKVRAVINQHLSRGERLDWTALLAAEADVRISYRFTSYESGPGSASAAFIFPSALERVHSRAVAQAPLPVDLVPVRLSQDAVMLDPTMPTQAIASIWPILDRWQSRDGARRTEVERLAQSFERGEQASNEAVEAYCLWALVYMARLAVEYQVPVRLSEG